MGKSVLAKYRFPLILASLAIAVFFFLSAGNHPKTEWECHPVSPLDETPPENPCFRAILSSPNQVTLQWRVVNSNPTVYIYNDFGPKFNDIGPQPAYCHSEDDNICSTSLRVDGGGFFRWQLEVMRDPHSQIYVSNSIRVPSAFAPAEVSGGGFVDILAPGSRTISWVPDERNQWSQDDTNSAWIEINKAGSLGWGSKRYPRFGPGANFIIPASAFSLPGEVAYYLRDCHLPPGSDVPFCSPAARAGFLVGSDRFLGPNPLQAESGKDLEITFTNNSGDVRILSSPTLIPSNGILPQVTTRDSSLTIEAERLTPGIHKIELTSCTLQGLECSIRKKADPVEQDGTIEQSAPGYYWRDMSIAVVTPDDGSEQQTISSPIPGLVKFTNSETPRRVEAGEIVAHTYAPSSKALTVLVDSPVAWVMDRHYTQDFQSGKAYPVLGGGEPLDITWDTNGGIWLINEFSAGIEHVTPSGTVKSFTVPLARSKEPGSDIGTVVKPFSNTLGKNIGSRATYSALAERATRAGPLLWFTQGGGSVWESVLKNPNHSRIISFDPGLSDDPSTRYDDRMCVYNVPSDHPQGFGNNQVVGLSATRNRIWIGETRGNFDPSVISAFIPNPDSCDNLLDFNDPQALANQSLQYCGPGRTPEQDGCMERFLLTALPAGIKVAHLATDPVDDSVWFTDAHGKFVGNLNPQRPEPIEIYPLPEDHSDMFYNSIIGFGGYPWYIRVDDDAVYFVEYLTQHILRFDKATATFDEIAIPNTTSQARLHSIDIDHTTNRLWFTVSNEKKVPMYEDSSCIGYIDLASWRDYLTDPEHTGKISAVMYSGLDTIPASEDRPGRHQAFRGISVDPATGNIAVATMFRKQFTVLKPHSGFWP